MSKKKTYVFYLELGEDSKFILAKNEDDAIQYFRDIYPDLVYEGIEELNELGGKK